MHTSGHWIQGCASSPLPWESQLLARSALITRGKSNRPAGDRILLARSALINRGDCIEYRPGVDHSIELPTGPQGIATANRLGADRFSDVRSCWPWFANVLQMFADVCILLAIDPGLCIVPALGSMVVHRVPSRGDRSCWPLFADVLQMYADVCILLALNPGLCILLALGSGIVHTSGHWIQGCASSPLPWGSQLLARSALITRWDSNRPAGDRSCKPSRSR